MASDAAGQGPRHYPPKPAAIRAVRSELSDRLDRARPRVHDATPEELPTGFVRRMHSPRHLSTQSRGTRLGSTRQLPGESASLPEFQVLNRSIFVFASLGCKVGASSLFPVSTRQAPVSRAVGSFTPARPATAGRLKTSYSRALKVSQSTPMLPVPGMLQLLTEADYRRMGLAPP